MTVRRATTAPALVAAAIVAVCLSASLGGGTATAQSDDSLVVAAYEIPPFVVRNGDVPGGFMYEIWEIVARQQGWSYEVVWIESLDDLGDLVDAGGADVAVAPLSSTSEREEKFDFTSAVVASGPVFGIHERTENPVTLAGALFNRDSLMLLLWSLVGLLVLGHLIWLVERKNPESDFASEYVRGVWDGVWWAAVTVTTVGYGDTSPKTSGGRVVAMIAMLGSLLLVGAFVSEVTSALQSGRATTVVATVDDLDGRPVAVVENSSYQTYLTDEGAETVGLPSQAEVFEAVDAGDVDIVVADRFTLDATGADYGVRGTDEPLYDEFIAYAVREDSPLRSDINESLSDLHRQGVVREIVDRWTD